MESFTTYEQHNYFSLAFSIYSGTSFDNQDALGQRMTFLLLEDGAGIISINNTTVPYIAPCLLCLQETEHCVIPVENHSHVKAIYFHPSIINSSLNYENIRDTGPNIPVTLLQDKELLKFFINRTEHFNGKFMLGPVAGKRFSALIDATNRQITEQNVENWPCRSRSYIMEMLFFLDNLNIGGVSDHEIEVEGVQEDFYPILLYVCQNYAQKLSVSELTEQFHMNKTTFSQMFRKNVGTTFLSYLNQLRISMAATMLRSTLIPIGEIMGRVGFTDQVHFFRTFKKLTGMTPTTYREKYNWM